jgi:hypothetical protein
VQEVKNAMIEKAINPNQKEIESIRSEKCPAERNSIIGRKLWLKEQDLRIERLISAQ